MLIKDLSGDNLIQVKKGFNTLASDVHWFHEKLSIGPTNLNQHIKKIEILTSSITKKINNRIKGLESNSRKLELALLSFILVIISIASGRWWSGYRLQKNNREKEMEVFNILNAENKNEEIKINILIREIFKLNNFKNCFKIMESYKLVKEDLVEKTPKDNELDKSSDFINMSLIVSNMLNSFSSQFFKYGILLDLNEIEDIWIKGNEEVLEQIIFSVVNYKVKKAKAVSGEKKIKIRLKREKNTALLEISSMRIHFDSLRENKDANKELPVEMIICQELIKDFDGEISFEDIVQDDKTTNSKMTIILKGVRDIAPVKAKRLVNLKKGKKRDILRELGNG
ncbi:MAG: hypothetical protein OXB84_08285 [Halobacteriovoraceae bacterium]|nr:hypothetical protein [Halobacteriovoraceae bacterium]